MSLIMQHHSPYTSLDTTGLVYTKYSPSRSCITLKSSSRNFVLIEQVGALPLFQGNSFHTGFTGTCRPKVLSPIRGRPANPSTLRAVVYSTSRFRSEPFSATWHFDTVITHPPNVGRSFQNPIKGKAVRLKIEVSNSLISCPFLLSITWATRPILDRPNEQVWSS